MDGRELAAKTGMPGFQILQLRPQSVVDGVTDKGSLFIIIKLIMTGDLPPQIFYALHFIHSLKLPKGAAKNNIALSLDRRNLSLLS
jgi:hypothetical protein